MGFRRVRALMVLFAIGCAFASGQAAAMRSSANDNEVSAFFPDVKPFVPANNKKSVAVSARKSKVLHVASKTVAVSYPKVNSGFHPKSKPFVPHIKKSVKISTHIRAAKITHAKVLHPATKLYMPQNAVHKKSHAAKIHVLPQSKKMQNSERALANLSTVKINLAANNRPSSVMKSTIASLEIKDDIQNAFQPSLVNAKQSAAASASKIVPVKVDAVVKGRVDERIHARKTKMDVITSAAVGVDASRITAAQAIHSIFVSKPQKKRPASVKTAMPTAKPDALVGAAAARQAMIDDSEAGKLPVVKVVTADLSKNEFYILGESEPVPDHLKNNPETQMVVLGGEADDAAKKIMEFKLAALNAARVRAARELAEKQASAKALAELELEEKEAMAKLAVAQKAVDDMQKLKQWQKERENQIGTVVEKVAPEYKKAIVQTVVPEEMHTNQVAVKTEDKLVPIDNLVLSAEKVADEIGHEGAIPHVDDTVAEVKIVAEQKPDVTKPAARKSVVRIKSNLSVERIAAKQINDEVISIKSEKHKKTVKAHSAVHKQKPVTKKQDAVVESEKSQNEMKKPVALNQKMTAVPPVSNPVPVNKSADVIAPKEIVIDNKQKVSVRQSSKETAVIKLAKTKKPARL